MCVCVCVMEDRSVLLFIGSASVTLQEEKDLSAMLVLVRERDILSVEHDYCTIPRAVCTTREEVIGKIILHIDRVKFYCAAMCCCFSFATPYRVKFIANPTASGSF